MRMTVCLCATAFLIVASRASSHHSNAEYDREVVLELEGRVVEAVWRNPHVGLTVRVENEDGSSTDWVMEAADYTGTMRRGVPDRAFEVGDWVRFAGNPSTRREAHMLVTNVLLSDGVEVLLVRTQPRWSDRFVGGGEWIIAKDAVESAAASGIFRVWTLASTNEPSFASDPPLTASARRGYDSYDVFDDPALRCEPIGLPRVMTRTGPHPIELVDRGEIIVLRGEYFDVEREIHMQPVEEIGELPFTRVGYSVGQWEEGALKVHTTHIDYPYFDIRGLEGVPQSRNVEITEVFRLDEGTQTLHYDITVADPETFTEPVIAEDYAVWEWRPGVAVMPYNCQL